MAFEDSRPRNPENQRMIAQMYDPHRLLTEMAEESNGQNSESSIDDYLDYSNGIQEWALRRMKGTHLDPENRKPVQVSDSPLSDYDIQFTRLNHTTDSITPSSLSNLTIPQASSESLSLNAFSPLRNVRKSSRRGTMNRKSVNYSPQIILREKQQAQVDRRLTKTRFTKEFSQIFTPQQFSTPNKQRHPFSPSPRADKNEELESIVSSSNGDALENDDDQSNRTLTNENKATDSVSTSAIPETQPHDTIIPETQDVPETQDYVPETQEDDIPVTQDDVANSPVRAQVTPSNTEQQAEPQDNISSNSNIMDISTRRIQSRPPIRGQSKIATPSTKNIPSTTPITKPIPKTPSRLPLPVARTPKTIRTIALTPLTPAVVEERPRPHVGDVTSSNAQNAENQIVILRTPRSSRLDQPAAVPPTVIPAPAQNITVNVNVSNTQPQSPHQATQTIRTHDQHIENAANGGDSGGDRRNSTNESLMTEESDSNANDANLSASHADTPRADYSNTSAKRRLFTQDDAEQTRRSATFNKVDNLTRTIDNNMLRDSAHLSTNGTQFRTRLTNSIPHSTAKSPSALAPSSHTFVKSKTSLQNATYDVRHSVDNRQSKVGIDSEEYLKTLASPQKTFNKNGSTFNNMVDLPSEAFLGSIDMTEDESNENEANATEDLNKNDERSARNSSQLNVNRKSKKLSSAFSPRVILSRISVPSQQIQKDNGNSSNIRVSQSYQLSPPVDFQDGSDLIPERSPATQKKVRKEISSLIQKSLRESQNESLTLSGRGKKRLSKKKVPPELAALEETLEKIREKPNKPPSEKPKPRRLRSVSEINENDDDEPVPSVGTSSTNQSTMKDSSSVFKKPEAPAPRKSKATTANESNSANKTVPTREESQDQDELIVTVDIQPVVYDDDFEPSNHVEDNEPSTSNQMVQRDPTPPPSPKQKKSAQTKDREKAKKNPPIRSKSKTKTKEPQVTEETENEPSNDVTSNENGNRRSRRTHKVNPDIAWRQEIFGNVVSQPQKAGKRKSKAINVAHRTEPMVSSRNEPEIEPPRKKPRAQSEIGHKITRPKSSSSKSVQSMKISTNTSKLSKIVEKHADATALKSIFQQELRGHINKKTQEQLQWWQELLDLTEKGPIVHRDDEVDIEFIKTNYGQLEISSTDKIAYTELSKVDYGFLPAQMKRFGIMRFAPKSAKAEGATAAELNLHILYGQFTIKSENEEIEATAGFDITVPKGTSYGLVNCTDEVGIIQFTYTEKMR